MVKTVKLRRRTKFGRNRPKCGRDMAIFRFFKLVAAAILDFLKFELLTVGRLKRANCVAMPISSKSVKPRPRYVDI